MLDKSTILNMLRVWVNQRPGLEFGNYGDWSNYRSEMRRITRQRADALQLLRAVELSSITAEELADAFKRAYSGRLTLTERKGKMVLDYCTGQYWPTEYRAAACAVLSAALWEHVRLKCMPKGELVHNSETGDTFERYNGLRAGDWIRRHFSREYGRGIASRWFD